MASGDKTRLAWYSELETTNTNVTTVTTDVTSLQETVTATTTGLVDKVAALESAVEDIEGTASTEITVTAILDENTTLAVAGATDGYYIFTSAPSDLAIYLSDGSINDVWQCSSAVWTTYLAYTDCPATLAVAATQGADETTYQKSEGSWIEVGTGSGSGGSITVTALYTSSTTIGNVSSAGYYIWTDTLPSDYTSYFTEGDISINDVLYYDGDAWDLYSTYVNAPASIYNEDDTSTYEKFESGWVISASALNGNTRDLDYGMFTLSSALSMSGVGTYRPVDTTVKIVGDISLSTNGINLIGGRTYKLTYSPYLNGMSSTNSTMSFYNYTTSTAIDPSTYLVAVTSSSAVITDNVVSTIYTPDLDCVVCIYVSTTTTGTFTANRGNKIVVEELPAQVTSYLDPDSVEVTNNDTATELQVLVSNGDGTATYTSDIEVDTLTINTSLVLGGSFGATGVFTQGTTLSSTSSPYPSNSATTVNIYKGGGSGTVTIGTAGARDLRVTKIPLGGNTAYCIITGYFSEYTNDEYVTLYFPQNVWSSYLGGTATYYEIDETSYNGSAYDLALIVQGGANYLQFKRDASLSSQTGFNFICYCLDTNYTTGSVYQ